MKTAIIIPARYGSTRFPGKPLAKIAGTSMLERVVNVARQAIEEAEDITIAVTTEDERIAAHCAEIDIPCLMTPASCNTGSDRVLAALKQMPEQPKFVINLQGDAPFTPPHAVQALLGAFRENPGIEVVTPVHQLGWEELDQLRKAKETTPFSGTTVIVGADHRALWFSKNIIPAIRKETSLRKAGELSPVWRHLGLYGFRTDILEGFCELPPGRYEELEGLEQLRLLENGIRIDTVSVSIKDGKIHSGIDSPEDIARAEASITNGASAS